MACKRTMIAAVLSTTGALALTAPAASAMVPGVCSHWTSGNYQYTHCEDYDGLDRLTVTGVWGTPAQNYWHEYTWY